MPQLSSTALIQERYYQHVINLLLHLYPSAARSAVLTLVKAVYHVKKVTGIKEPFFKATRDLRNAHNDRLKIGQSGGMNLAFTYLAKLPADFDLSAAQTNLKANDWQERFSNSTGTFSLFKTRWTPVRASDAEIKANKIATYCFFKNKAVCFIGVPHEHDRDLHYTILKPAFSPDFYKPELELFNGDVSLEKAIKQAINIIFDPPALDALDLTYWLPEVANPAPYSPEELYRFFSDTDLQKKLLRLIEERTEKTIYKTFPRI